MSFFTVRVANAGLGDQMNQLSYLYAVGRLLSYVYVHTPFACPRSNSRPHLASRLINRVFKSIGYSNASDRLVRFTGLDRDEMNIDDAGLRGYKIVDINLEQILTACENPAISHIREYIDKTVPSPEKKIYSFAWTAKMYELIPKLDYLISS